MLIRALNAPSQKTKYRAEKFEIKFHQDKISPDTFVPSRLKANVVSGFQRISERDLQSSSQYDKHH